MPQNFIIGTVVFLLSCMTWRFFSIKAQKELSIKNKMLFTQQITNINKYSMSVLIAASVLFFTCIRQFNLSLPAMIPVYFSVVIIYTAVFSFFISNEISKLKLPKKTTFYYVASRFFLLFGLGMFILSLFLCFGNILKPVHF
jgi:hypothetical protein